MLEVLADSVKPEEHVPGMQADGHEHEHDDEHDDNEYEHDDDGHEPGDEHEHDHRHEEADEHVWLSLRRAAAVCDAICAALQKLDPDCAETYRENTAAYKEELATLDEKYRAVIDQAEYNTLLFGDRFPFRYLVDDYGIEYYAAFVGCSSETEASFETILFLSGKLEELGLPCVLTIEGARHKIAETIVQNSDKGADILSMDSMQSVTAEAIKNGASYLSCMEKNFEALKTALGAREPDIDLSVLSGTVAYAEVYNMLTSPADYIGKLVKMRGSFDVLQATDGRGQPIPGRIYFACLLADATGCCSQGLEFVLAGDYTYPEDYPAIGETVTVAGLFQTYEEDEYRYCHLVNARLEPSDR